MELLFLGCLNDFSELCWNCTLPLRDGRFVCVGAIQHINFVGLRHALGLNSLKLVFCKQIAPAGTRTAIRNAIKVFIAGKGGWIDWRKVAQNLVSPIRDRLTAKVVPIWSGRC